MSSSEEITAIARQARAASRLTPSLPSAIKNRVLLDIAGSVRDQSASLKEANLKDLAQARENGLTASMIDRLTLTDAVIDSMIGGLTEVAQLPDPVGEVVGMWKRPNGLLVGRMRIPIGVIGIIYESRPNVTVDAASLCLKSGNAVILRGGSEAFYSNGVLARLMQDVLRKNGVPEAAVQLIPFIDREAVYQMLSLADLIDLIIPRGGEGLIRSVVEHSKIPVIKHYKGVCHIFVDASASEEMAESLIVNAKLQRPGVCNALETLLIHAAAAPSFLPRIVSRLQHSGVELLGCEKCREILPGLRAASEDDWYREYLDLTLSLKIVSSMEEAVNHIHQYGSMHTDVIVTSDYSNAQHFLHRVQSSVVMVNASTRFNDGNQLGLGAEIGISTTKLHAFGPMGLNELTTLKFVVYGEGQVRE